MAAIYRDLVADDTRTAQVVTDVLAALARGRHCLVLTQWTAHLDRLADPLRAHGHDPVVLRGGMGAKARAAALARLEPQPDGRRCSSSPPAPTSARASTARRSTPSSSPHRSPSKADSSSTPAGSCARTRARPPPRSTTTTTSPPASSPPRWPNALPATSASASPTPATDCPPPPQPGTSPIGHVPAPGRMGGHDRPQDPRALDQTEKSCLSIGRFARHLPRRRRSQRPAPMGLSPPARRPLRLTGQPAQPPTTDADVVRGQTPSEVHQQTVAFGLDGQTYEIDLDAEHAGELRSTLQRYTDAARRIGGQPAAPAITGRARPRRSAATTQRNDAAAIRA